MMWKHFSLPARLRRLAGLFRGPGSAAGATAVEFGLAAPVFLGLLFGVMELGRAGFTQAVLHHAAGETSRWVVVNPRDEAGGETLAQYETRIEDYARSKLRLVAPGNLYNVDAPPVPNPADNTTSVNVTLEYDFQWYMPFVNDGVTRFTAKSSGFLVENN